MKKTMIAFVLLLSNLSVLQAALNEDYRYMSASQQEDYVANVAKNWRRQRWQAGYEDVNSYEFKVTKDFLDNHVKSSNNSRYETPLNSDEIADLYRCLYSKSGCQLYAIDMGSNFWGGSGTEMMFVMLYTKSGKHFSIEHVVYAE